MDRARRATHRVDRGTAARSVTGDVPRVSRWSARRMRRPVASGAARAVAMFGIASGIGACASPGYPPGGPPRFIPPRLIAVTPDTLAVNVRARTVEFTFDEVVNQASRGSGAASGVGGGATGLESLVLVSPRNGSVAVDWARERVYVHPRRGFRPNATYTVTILPGLSDLRNNTRDSAVVAVFSTGATIARGELTGVVFDWVNARTAPGAVVEAVAADSITYVTLADSVGRFTIPNMPVGTYLVRGAVDVNGNRSIDPREPFDSARATATLRTGRPLFTAPIPAEVLAAELQAGSDTTRPKPRRTPARSTAVGDTTTPPLALYAFVHDTLAPRVGTVSVVDSTTIRLSFDRPLRPDQPFAPAQFRIAGPDSAPVPIREVLTATIADSIAQAATQAAAQAAAQARARPDSGTQPPAARAPATPNASAIPPRSAQPGASAADSVRRAAAVAAGPKLRRPVPPVDLVIRLGAPLRPNTIYRLAVRDLRSLSGVAGPTDRTFTTPRPPRPAPTAPVRAPTGPPRPTPVPTTPTTTAPATTAPATKTPASVPPPGRAP